MNKIMKTKDIDYVIAADTDSIYITFEEMVNKAGVTDEQAIINAIDAFCESNIQPYLNKCFEELAVMMNSYEQKMHMKRESIASKGIWKAKKMYMLNVWDNEGVRYDKPKIKIKGIEAVRSSTPSSCRNAIKECINIMLNKNEEELRKYVLSYKEKFMSLPFEDVASPRGVNGMTKYADKNTIYGLKTPIHVKGSLIFNHLLKKHGINNIPPIVDGDKVKFAYLKVPNPIQASVIATADYIPKEFNIDQYIDRDMQFQKAFLDPLKSITNIIGWEPEHVSTLEGFFG